MLGRDLGALFRPRSIAVIGASPSSPLGARLMENVGHWGYDGPIYPVNPRYQEIAGRRCYPDVSAIPGDVDAAIVGVSAGAVPATLEQIGRRGVRAAVVFATGYAEAGPEGVRRQAELIATASRYGILMCGPNCVGLASPAGRQAMYLEELPAEAPRGTIAAVCQSGSVAIGLLNSGRLGFSHLVSIGNEAVLDAATYLAYFVEDSETKVLVAFIEGIRSASLFLDVARRARELGKPLIVLKVGSSARARAASLAHTGSLAGSDAVFSGLCEQFGIIRVHDMDDLVETAGAFARMHGRWPRGNRLGAVTISGGQVGVLHDLAARASVDLPELAEPTRSALATALSRPVSMSNPLDAGGTGGAPQVYQRCLELVAGDPHVDIMAVCSPAHAEGARAREIATATAALARQVGKPVLFLTAAADAVVPQTRAALDAAGIPILAASRSGFEIVARAIRYGSSGRMHAENIVALPTAPTGEVEELLRARGPTLSEHASLQILAAHGIPVVPHALASTADDAASAATRIGFPVAVKICSPDLPHKSDVGAVKLGLHDADAVRRAYAEVIAAARAGGRAIAIDGVLVQAMARGIEMILGVARDAEFGPTVMLGLGGVYVDLLDDVSLRVAPVSPSEAVAMIDSLRGARMLDGYRGTQAVDRKALADIVVKLGRLAVAQRNRIKEIDINPLIVSPAGAVAVDALVVLNEDKSP